MAIHVSRRRVSAGALPVLGLITLGPLFWTGAADSADDSGPLTLPSAINKAGRQRMLTQRMGKAWAMQALKVEPEMAAKLQQQSQALFISQLDELQRTTPTPELKAAAAALAQAWESYRRDLALTPGKENAARVYGSGDQTLQRAHELTVLYEKHLGTPLGRLVNIAGRERMLSQRMARAFYFGKLGIGANTAQDLETARKEFITGLKDLADAPQNTPDIRQELTLAEQQWMFFRSAVDSKLPDATSSANVAITSERILEQMNVLTAKYERLVA
jgi:nitrate/nitrite-specific signal transduction histidine kinase